MSGFTVYCRADQGKVFNNQSMEIPIRGSAQANILVTITGVAVPDLDNERDLDSEDNQAGDIYITTLYQLDKNDRFVDGSALVSLARIDADDSVNGTFFDADDVPLLFAINAVEVGPDMSRFIQLHLAVDIAGDMVLKRIAFQANILLASQRTAMVK